MMKPEVIKLEGELRDTGRKESSRLRDEKRVPAVLYGPNVKENVHCHVGELELERLLAKRQTQLQDLSVDGESYQTLLKRVEFDPITDRPVHADFYVVDEKRPVALSVPIQITGTPVGVRDGGGRIFQPMRIVRIKALPSAIPAQFELDITSLGIGDAFHVEDLDAEGITLLDDLSRAIVVVTPPKSEEVFTTTATEGLPEEEAGAEEEEAGTEEVAGEESEEGNE